MPPAKPNMSRRAAGQIATYWCAGCFAQERGLPHGCIGADPILGTRGQVVIPEGGDSMIVGDAGTGKSTLRSTWHSTSPRVIPGPASQRRRRGRC